MVTFDHQNLLTRYGARVMDGIRSDVPKSNRKLERIFYDSAGVLDSCYTFKNTLESCFSF